jgi:hypothetical protein
MTFQYFPYIGNVIISTDELIFICMDVQTQPFEMARWPRGASFEVPVGEGKEKPCRITPNGVTIHFYMG